MLVVKSLGTTTGAAVQGLCFRSLAFFLQEVSQRERGVDLRNIVFLFVTELELLPQQCTRALRFSRVEGTEPEAAQRGASTLNVARSLCNGVRISQQSIAFMARVITRQERVEPERRVDDLILKAFCPGGGVGQTCQDNSVFAVLIGLFFDDQIETLEILGRKTIQDPRIANLCQPALNRALPIGDLARNQQHDVAGTLPTAKTQPIPQ
jgi:hypothetical protein